MPVPETAVDEYDGTPACEDEIWFAGQIFHMQPKAKPGGMQRPSDTQFGFRIDAADRCHVAATRGAVVNVGHWSGGFPLLRRLYKGLNMRLHDPGDFLKHGNCD